MKDRWDAMLLMRIPMWVFAIIPAPITPTLTLSFMWASFLKVITGHFTPSCGHIKHYFRLLSSNAG